MDRDARGFKRALSKALNTRDSTIQRWYKGSHPEAEYFAKIYEVFQVTPDTLLGIDQMHPRISAHMVKVPSPRIELSTALSDNIEMGSSTFFLIPLLYCCESQSILETVTLQGIEAKNWTLLNQREIPRNKTNLISMWFCQKLGSSMLPAFKSRDVAIIDLDDTNIQPNYFYAVFWEGHPTIRRLQQIDEHQILLIPENKEYAIEAISTEDNQSLIIGKVICSITHY
jgi:transcriptional regulator with XRE-family HTH domain